MALDVEISVGANQAVSVPVTAANTLISSSPCVLLGWSLAEATGAAVASVEFVTGGNPVGESRLAAGASDTHSIAGGGIYIRSGLTMNVLAGSVKGAVYISLFD